MSTAVIISAVEFPHMAWAFASLKNAKTLGELLSARRDDLLGSPREIKQKDISRETGFSQAYISKIEDGLSEEAMKKWRGDRVYTFLRAYKFTEDEMREIAERFGLALLIPEPSMTVELDWVSFDVYHAASAGTGKPEVIDGEAAAIPRSVLKKHGVNVADVMVIRVNGDCLVSQAVRYSNKNIAHGDYAAINTAATPKDGDVVAYWDSREDIMIIKYFKDDVKNGMVYLYDARGLTVPVPDVDDDLVYRGVVFYRGGSL
jgi:hypothetical protein